MNPKLEEPRGHPNNCHRKRRARFTQWAAIAAIALLAFGTARGASTGPASGGNTLTITGTGLGNGSDITNVTICGVTTVVQSQTANSVTVILGMASDSGTGDVVIYSASLGVTRFVNGYTYRPLGYIYGQFLGWSNNIPEVSQYSSVSAATCLNGKIYAFGGAAVYVLDTSQPYLGWSTVINLPSSSISAAVSANGKIYAFGGAALYAVDPSQPYPAWSSVINLPSSISAAASVDGKIYAIGGGGTNVYVFDPSQPTLGWSSVTNLPTSLGGLAAVGVNGKIYAIGANTSSNSTVYAYDPSQPAQGWLTLSNLQRGQNGLSMAATANGEIYAFGAYLYWSNPSYPYNYLILPDGYVYDPSSNRWGNFSGLPPPLYFAAPTAVASANGNIYLFQEDIVHEAVFAPGVVPSSGALAGSNTVTISGNYLGQGDVTNVTLCGIPATILADDSPAQIVVRAGAATIPEIGDVVVSSTSYGVTVRTNGYSYFSLSPIIMTSNSLPPGLVGIAYNQTLTVSGGTTPYTWAIASGSLPQGLSLSADGVISGIPAVATNASFTAQVTDNGGLSMSNHFSLMIGVETATNGPAAGGNTLTITWTGLGNGSDITNVTVCGIAAVIQSQTANSITVVLGAGGSGWGNIQVYSASAGITTFANSYAYNLMGAIGTFMGWSSVSNLPNALIGSAAASLNGKIYVIGGSSSSQVVSTVYVYDSAQPTQGWLSVSNLPQPLYNLAATTVNGKIYAIGGGGTAVYVYDPSQPTLGWLTVSNLPAALDYLAAVTANGKIYAIGGTNSAYVYDPSQPTQGWLSLSNLPVALSSLGAASVNGKIYALGGLNSQTSLIYPYVFVYDPSQPAQGWLRVSNLPAALYGMGVTTVNGNIYAFGGANANYRYSTVYVYNPAQPTLGWLYMSSLPEQLVNLAGASANGNIFAIGGFASSFSSNVYEGSFSAGVAPSSGPLAGGNTVTITGSNLGNGDVTNVTLCGIPATILADYSPTQVVVSAGAAVIPANGDVVVNSTSYGVTVGINAYSYFSLSPIIITGSPLPGGIVGTAYNQTLTAGGGTMPYTWAIASGSLPPGLNLSANGVISGIPVVATNASFTAQVTDNGGLSSSNLLSLTITVQMMFAFDGTNLQLSWPTNCLGWVLEAQTNPPGAGLGTNWFPVAASTTTNCVPILVDPNNGSAFFRLQQQ